MLLYSQGMNSNTPYQTKVIIYITIYQPFLSNERLHSHITNSAQINILHYTNKETQPDIPTSNTHSQVGKSEYVNPTGIF